jgi:hypothetical protein
MSLADWLKNSWLVEHESSVEEIAALLAIVERDLANATLAGLSEDWKLSIAYNAGLQAATVALAATGYRAAREQHHYRTITNIRLRHLLPAAAGRRVSMKGFREKQAVAHAAGSDERPRNARFLENRARIARFSR